LASSIIADPTPVTEPLVNDWDRHWSEFAAAAELSPATHYRRRLALDLLNANQCCGTVRILEIGSGTGEFAETFMARTPRAMFLGLDLSHTGVEISTRRVPPARFLQRDLLASSSAPDGLDFLATHALCCDVLEHVDSPELLLRNASAYMAKECRLVVTVPGGWYNAFYRRIGHRRHYTPAEISTVLSNAGFTVERAVAEGFPFFNLYRMLITLRGDRLIDDATGSPSWIMRASAAVFRLLFHLNFTNPWGWQTMAVARYTGH